MAKSRFEREFYNSLKYLSEKKNIWFYKFYDNPPPTKSKKVRFSTKRPFDFIVLTNRKKYAFELKSKKSKSIPFTNIPEHQEVALKEFQTLDNSYSYFLFNYRLGRGNIRCFVVNLKNYFLLKKLREEIRFIFKGAKKIGLITAYDANAGDGWENQKELQTLKNYIYPNTDLIFLNQDEARHLTGLSNPFKSILKIEKNAKTVVIKLGKDGALIRHLDKLYRIGGFPIGSRVADTVGAGDAFQAAFSYFYLRKKPIEICGIMGCANGATTVLHHGGLDGQCTTEELKRFISQFDILDMGNRTIQIKPRGYISRYA